MRTNVLLSTFQKVKDYLKDLKEPMTISDIGRKLHVDYNSMKLIKKSLNKNLLNKIKENSKWKNKQL